MSSLLARYLRLAEVTHVFGYPGQSIVALLGSGSTAPLVIEARIDSSESSAQF